MLKDIKKYPKIFRSKSKSRYNKINKTSSRTKKNIYEIKDFHKKTFNYKEIYDLLAISFLKLNTNRVYNINIKRIYNPQITKEYIIYLYGKPIAYIELENKFHYELQKRGELKYMNDPKFYKILNLFVNVTIFEKNIKLTQEPSNLVSVCINTIVNYLHRKQIFNLNKQFVSLVVIVNKDNKFGYDAMQHVIKTTNFKYMGSDVFDYDIEYDIFKLSLNRPGSRPSINDFNKKYIISRQIIDKSCLEDESFRQILEKEYKLQENQNEFKYYENNTLVYLHNFETHSFYNTPLIKYVPIFMLNNLIYPYGLRSYYKLYNDMLIHDHTFTEEHFITPELVNKDMKSQSYITMNAYSVDDYMSNTLFYNITEETFEFIKTNYSGKMYFKRLFSKKYNLARIDGYSFSININFIISIINNEKTLFIFDKGGILLYKDTYYKKYDDKLDVPIIIKGSGLGYPNDINKCDTPVDVEIINKNIFKIIHKIFNLYKDDVNLFYNCINGYKLFNIGFNLFKDLSVCVLYIFDVKRNRNYFHPEHADSAEKFFNYLNDNIYRKIL